jgi:hypothetical protein
MIDVVTYDIILHNKETRYSKNCSHLVHRYTATLVVVRCVIFTQSTGLLLAVVAFGRRANNARANKFTRGAAQGIRSANLGHVIGTE